MRRRLVAVAMATVCAAALAARPAAAQTTARAQLSGGYQALSLQGDGGETFALGWWGELAAHVSPRASLLFLAGGNYKTITESLGFDGIAISATADLSIHHFMGGARWRFPRPNGITPFVHALVGAARLGGDVSAEAFDQGTSVSIETTVDETRAAFAAGGGVDIGLTERFGVRAGADYVRIFDDEDGRNALRFAAGVVWSF